MSPNTDWSDVPVGDAATRYARLIIDRARVGMPDDTWHADWANAPLTVTDHRTAPLRLVAPLTLGAGLLGDRPVPISRAVADVCHAAYGTVAARISVNLNDRPEVHARAGSVKWGRGAASGGGRYCVDAYLVHGGDEDLPPGVHHYSAVANGWETLQRHDRTEELRRIQGYPDRAVAYLVLTIDYWRSSFKYSDFAYQATSMDVGTFFGAERELLGDDVAGSLDMEVDETAIADLLGIRADDRGVYAVQPWGRVVAGSVPAGREAATPAPAALPAHSRDVRPVRFPTTAALQRDMAAEAPDRSARELVRCVVPSPARAERARAWRELAERETSFGRFGQGTIPLAALRELLDEGRRAAEAVAGGSPRPTRTAHLVYADRVEGLDAGLYLDEGDGLRRLRDGDHSAFLESTYFLRNYMGRLAACTVLLCGDVVPASAASGVRGYRRTNAVIGAACQALLTRAGRLGVATGTALGFDVAAHSEHAGLDDGMSPMLMIMLGVDAPASGRVHARVLEGARP
ncbi:nitroreductase family protein [Clavibacter capsici]|uniref:nitroreductase family protein n=1 Tax=Clavibacter capsici TaxID=1874630 RepID=UPI00293F73C4|nr:nitroreductase family protein [Clavibacter capsici]